MPTHTHTNTHMCTCVMHAVHAQKHRGFGAYFIQTQSKWNHLYLQFMLSHCIAGYPHTGTAGESCIAKSIHHVKWIQAFNNSFTVYCAYRQNGIIYLFLAYWWQTSGYRIVTLQMHELALCPFPILYHPTKKCVLLGCTETFKISTRACKVTTLNWHLEDAMPTLSSFEGSELQCNEEMLHLWWVL